MMQKLLISSTLLMLGLNALGQTSQRIASSDHDRLVGAWHLVNIQPDGKSSEAALPKGMLIYTKDGHMSVQLMYPAQSLSNEYVEQGYEGSFGAYDLDESRHLVTHHVQGSVTRDSLVGKDLPRNYEITPDGHLLIRSANPAEHWLVTWEKY
jgi:Lipocalin-like domain